MDLDEEEEDEVLDTEEEDEVFFETEDSGEDADEGLLKTEGW